MRFIDLFAGAGGMSLGFKRAGFAHVLGVETNGAARRTYAQNIGRCVGLDIGNVGETIRFLRDEGPIDLIVGGPPCTDFSSVGLRDESRGSADLTAIFALVVESLRPRAFVMENVAESEISDAYKFAVGGLRNVGYLIGAKIVETKLCGVPQQRKRLFTIGIRDGKNGDKFGKLVEHGYAKGAMSIRAYGELTECTFPETYYVHPRGKDRRGIWSHDAPAATIRGVNRPIPPGYHRHRNDAGDPMDSRALTPHERALIQTFPPDFLFVGSASDVKQQIGNAVPPLMAEFVAHRLREMLALDGIDAIVNGSLGGERANALHQPSIFDDVA